MKLSALPIPASQFVEWRFTNPFGPPSHYGFDFGIDEGTPVMAAQSGEVLFIDADNEYNAGFGNYITLWHDAARTSTGVWKATQFTLYAHLARVVVKNGDKVQAGQVIGYSGNTGNSTGPHLHFQVQETKYPVAARPAENSGTCLDPKPLLMNLAPAPVVPPIVPPVTPPVELNVPGELKVVATPFLRLRGGPGTNFTDIWHVNTGANVTATGERVGGWLKVNVTVSGWMYQGTADDPYLANA